MKDIQVTVDSFKKFSQNIFTIDNIDDLTIFGNGNHKCKFTVKLFETLVLDKFETIDMTDSSEETSNPIEWDIYLTSVFIGGYKQEQYARPGCLFDNVLDRWNGELARSSLFNMSQQTYWTKLKDPNFFKKYKNRYVLQNDSIGQPLATYGIFLNAEETGALGSNTSGDPSGNYHPGISTGTYESNNNASSRIDYYTDSSGDVISGSFYNDFNSGNESVHAFVIKIHDQTGNVYTSSNNFIGALPSESKRWNGDASGVEPFEYLTPESNMTGGLVLNNIRKRRRDGFNLSGAKIEQNVVDINDQKGQLTVQDYLPFNYVGKKPIYLTTVGSSLPGQKQTKDVTGGYRVNRITVEITDQNGYSIWHPAHVSQMRHKYGIDANPPTASRRIILKLTYRPRVKRNNNLLNSLNILNKKIGQLIGQ